MAGPRTHDAKYYQVAATGSLADRLAAKARNRIYRDFLRLCQPCPTDTILDVGASDEMTTAANMLEQNYPHPAQITAAGLGDADAFRAAYPTMRYRQIAANKPLPFEDRQFDIVTSNAVLEHVGSIENQRAFLSELFRVGRRVFVTVPHRYFPVEHHTAIPLLHWSALSFPLACRVLGKRDWAMPENLILMTRRGMAAVSPPAQKVRITYTGLRLGPCSSNLLLFADGT